MATDRFNVYKLLVHQSILDSCSSLWLTIDPIWASSSCHSFPLIIYNRVHHLPFKQNLSLAKNFSLDQRLCCLLQSQFWFWNSSFLYPTMSQYMTDRPQHSTRNQHSSGNQKLALRAATPEEIEQWNDTSSDGTHFMDDLTDLDDSRPYIFEVRAQRHSHPSLEQLNPLLIEGWVSLDSYSERNLVSRKRSELASSGGSHTRSELRIISLKSHHWHL